MGINLLRPTQITVNWISLFLLFFLHFNKLSSITNFSWFYFQVINFSFPESIIWINFHHAFVKFYIDFFLLNLEIQKRICQINFYSFWCKKYNQSRHVLGRIYSYLCYFYSHHQNLYYWEVIFFYRIFGFLSWTLIH